jgi:RNA polymerase sigma factor (sigma-70 family)
VSPEQVMLDDEMTDGVGEAILHLTEQQKTVIGHRFGLNGQPPLTLQQTGEEMGLSRERVRQIECQAKERIRQIFRRRRRINAAPKGPYPQTRSSRTGVAAR